jgi:hypothetical protein
LNDADNAKKKYPEFYVAKARILIRRDTGRRSKRRVGF